MTPYYSDAWLDVYQGDCREVMRSLEPESVHCVVTSPPYWGLRDYGQTDQLGLEATPEEYVANLVGVLREVRRVLRNDGTVWLNLGDSYNAYNGGAGPSSSISAGASTEQRPRLESGFGLRYKGLKPKDLVGIPWRVALALQADGWYLRSDIIWAKPNPMPESVTDRPTKAHEYLFLLSKSPRYYYDADAVREPHAPDNAVERPSKIGDNPSYQESGWKANHLANQTPNPAGRNLRSVWTIATQPYPGAHFATFPRKLVEPCVKAGTSERGVCPECGAPWVRVVETHRNGRDWNANNRAGGPRLTVGQSASDGMPNDYRAPTTTGWRPSCPHYGGTDEVTRTAEDPEGLQASPLVDGHQPQVGQTNGSSGVLALRNTIPATVLDPFAGSGTTGLVAQSLNRRAILIDLNGDYLVQAMQRNRDIPLGLGAA